MTQRTIAAFFIAVSLAAQCVMGGASAENQMGYQLLSTSQAAALPRGGGRLGIDVGRQQQITDGGMTFELLRVNSVRQNSPGDRAGFKAGDQIIAVDGHVFPSVATFAAYVGSGQPGHPLSIDYIPMGGGPQQAQRINVVLGGAGRDTGSVPARTSTGLSTGTKIAIGVGAVALFGCYELGCFTKKKAVPVPVPVPNKVDPVSASQKVDPAVPESKKVDPVPSSKPIQTP